MEMCPNKSRTSLEMEMERRLTRDGLVLADVARLAPCC